MLFIADWNGSTEKDPLVGSGTCAVAHSSPDSTKGFSFCLKRANNVSEHFPTSATTTPIAQNADRQNGWDLSCLKSSSPPNFLQNQTDAQSKPYPRGRTLNHENPLCEASIIEAHGLERSEASKRPASGR
jgi:hypothetical protein